MTQTQNYENNWIIICLVDKSFLHLLGLIMDGGGGGSSFWGRWIILRSIPYQSPYLTLQILQTDKAEEPIYLYIKAKQPEWSEQP